MNILKKINRMRLERNWSIYRLSVESGIPQSTLTNMFNRETLPSITTLESICNAFSISLAEFFTDSNETLEALSEKQVLSLYNSISHQSQKTIVDLMNQLKISK